MEAFTVAPARYAEGMLAVTPCDNVQGFKGRSSRLVEYLKGRWSNREHAYIMSPTKVVKLRKLIDEGWDSNILGDEVFKESDPTTRFKKPPTT